DRILSIPVDDHSLGGNQCRRKAPDFECDPPGTAAKLSVSAKARKTNAGKVVEDLGPSFFAARQLGAAKDARNRNPYCTDQVMKRALAAKEEDECYERQELRLQEDRAPPANERYVYEIRFRMPAKVDDQTHSIRWASARWKRKPWGRKYAGDLATKGGRSPFLPKRYDNALRTAPSRTDNTRARGGRLPHPT